MKRREETRVSLMRISLAAAALAAIATPALASQATDTFKAFQQVCGDTRAEYAASLAASGQSGWQAIDAPADVMKGVTATDKSARGKNLGDATLRLSLVNGTASNGAIKVQNCTVQTDRGGYPELKAAAQAWLGLPPVDSTDKLTTFRFTDDNGHFKAVADTEQEAAAAGTGMEVLSLKRDGNNVVVDYVKFKK